MLILLKTLCDRSQYAQYDQYAQLQLQLPAALSNEPCLRVHRVLSEQRSEALVVWTIDSTQCGPRLRQCVALQLRGSVAALLLLFHLKELLQRLFVMPHLTNTQRSLSDSWYTHHMIQWYIPSRRR